MTSLTILFLPDIFTKCQPSVRRKFLFLTQQEVFYLRVIMDVISESANLGEEGDYVVVNRKELHNRVIRIKCYDNAVAKHCRKGWYCKDVCSTNAKS